MLLAPAIGCLAGMAYCHIRDVGMKFEEHVYYMGWLFVANIMLSLALIPAIVVAEQRDSAVRRVVWTAAGGLAALTIAGFVWSRTVGFPQMADHVGEWDALGLTSIVFEGILVLVSGLRVVELAHPPRPVAAARAPDL